MLKKVILTFVLCLSFPATVKAAGLGGPIWGLIQGMEDGRRAAQEDALVKQQLELQRQQEEYTKLLIEKQRFENAELRKKIERDKKRSQEDLDRVKAMLYFIKYTKPKIVRVHPDFDEIMKDKGYWQWAEKQEPNLKHAAFDSPDPADIIWALYEFKKYKAVESSSHGKSTNGWEVISIGTDPASSTK